MQQELKMMNNRNQELEMKLDKSKREQQNHEHMINSYGQNLNELETQFEKREVELDSLRQHVSTLKQ